MSPDTNNKETEKAGTRETTGCREAEKWAGKALRGKHTHTYKHTQRGRELTILAKLYCTNSESKSNTNTIL